jgi:NAD(P)-dependent dehydrogenase (short-subunit alcohol dehydrogenase family)
VGRLDGKVAVVTGGAKGIGRACCERFAEEGADVVVADIDEALGRATATDLRSYGRSAIFARMDARRVDDNEAVAQLAVDELGGLDILVTSAGISNAGYGRGQPQTEPDPVTGFTDLPLAEWNTVLDVNLTGTFLALQAAVRRMRGRGGSIVTIGSIASKVPSAGRAPYTTSKAGVWMLTKWAALALAPARIRVNAVGPGVVETDLLRRIDDVPGLRQRALSPIPMGRFATPREIAQTVLFLASDESSYTTGELFHVDGGFYTD